MIASVVIEPETGVYVLRLPAGLCEAAGISTDRPLTVESVADGLLLRTARAPTLEQKLAAFDPASHGGEIQPDRRVGRERPE
jgi:antitoxin MazE